MDTVELLDVIGTGETSKVHLRQRRQQDYCHHYSEIKQLDDKLF